MADYYPILLHAVTAPEAGDAEWRRDLYNRARNALIKQMRNRRPPASPTEFAAERAALDAAIKRIEADRPWVGLKGTSDVAQTQPAPKSDRSSILELLPLRGPVGIALAVVVAALCAGGYTYWSTHRSTSKVATAPSNTASVPAAMTTKDGDIRPGIDGGAMDASQSYVFRRQPTFYRTLQPVGTIIVDKLQHFLYLIEPKNVALRYGIGIGDQCVDLAGLRRIASMAEWPQWQAPPEMVKAKRAEPGILAGGPGNPLGARVLNLDDNASRINGTNAPKTIGTTVSFGCFRLANDDIIDLYRRVYVGTQVVVN
jgi:lipoprotein-anchoring transpeptidase ErfK/SrfK